MVTHLTLLITVLIINVCVNVMDSTNVLLQLEFEYVEQDQALQVDKSQQDLTQLPKQVVQLLQSDRLDMELEEHIPAQREQNIQVAIPGHRPDKLTKTCIEYRQVNINHKIIQEVWRPY